MSKHSLILDTSSDESPGRAYLAGLNPDGWVAAGTGFEESIFEAARLWLYDLGSGLGAVLLETLFCWGLFEGYLLIKKILSAIKILIREVSQ